MTPNLRVFFKFLNHNKVYTTVTVAGFGISLMFVIVLGLYVRQELSVDNFHEKGDRIYLLAHDYQGGKWSAFPNPTGGWLMENCPDVENFTRLMDWDGDVKRNDGEVISTEGMLADSSFFNIFSFPLIEGNPSHVLTDRNSIVLSRSFAAKMFGTANPVGENLTISTEVLDLDFTVTGLFADFPANTIFRAPDFIVSFLRAGEVWGQPDILEDYGNSSTPLFILEREGGDIRSQGTDIIKRFQTLWFLFERGHVSKLEFIPFKNNYFGGADSFIVNFKKNTLSRVMLYLGIALLILVVALLNYINMTVAQSGFRGREVALKKLHGASRGAIVIQLLVESLVVTLISFGAGLVMAFMLESFFDGVLDTTLGLSEAFTLPVMLIMAGAVVVLAAVSGIVPAMVMSRFKPIEIIKGSFSRRVKGVYSRVLAIFQYAVSIALLVCCTVIVMQSRYLSTRDVGLRKEGVLLLQNLEHSSTGKLALKRALEGISGVEAVSMLSANPFYARSHSRAIEHNGVPLSVEVLEADSSFLHLFDVEVEFTGVDPHGNDKLYLNRAAYNALDAAELHNEVDLGMGHTMVAGVMDDFNFRPLYEPQGLMAVKTGSSDLSFAVNVIAVKISKNSDLFAVAETVKREYTDFIGNDRYRVEWAEDSVREFYEQERRTSRIMGAFTVLVVVIMLMGIFAMSLYMLRQKEKEVAVRKVHGSTIGEILSLLSRQSVVSVAAAFAVACPVAWWAMLRWLEGFPYRIDMKPWIFAAAGATVLLLTFVCVGWQSWRAATANPVKFLKSQ